MANAKSTQTAWQLIVIAITKMNQLASLKKKLIIQNYTALLSNILVVAMVIMPPLIDVKIRLLLRLRQGIMPNEVALIFSLAFITNNNIMHVWHVNAGGRSSLTHSSAV